MAHPVIEVMLRESMGLDVASIGSSAIDRAVRDRITATNSGDDVGYARLLAASATEMQELIESVVVPETWFFRNPEAFRALAVMTTGEWLPSHPGEVLRVLSFPCSTGEEPYSIAMTLRDAGLSSEQFRIDGFDISMRALQRAEKAVYGRNSFRGAELSFRERYFRPERTSYALIDEVRASVTFEQRNVVEEDFARRAPEYDVIFCRNVLIYFDQVTQQRVLRNLDVALRPRGVLFVGPAESFQVAIAGFASVPQPQAFVFRKAEAAQFDFSATKTRTTRVVNTPAKSVEVARRAARPRTAAASVLERSGFPTAAGEGRAPLQSIPAAAADDLSQARRLADSGDLTRALELAERNLAGPAPTAEGYHVLGLIRDATGDTAAAMESYRKALYLDPDHLDALIHLAFLLERSGDATSAQRFRERARRAEKRQRV
jgi:chemotaxis protein methyltransferase WspC